MFNVKVRYHCMTRLSCSVIGLSFLRIVLICFLCVTEYREIDIIIVGILLYAVNREEPYHGETT